MNNKLSLIDKIIIFMLVSFSFLKLGNFISYLYSTHHIRYLEAQKKYIALSEKNVTFNSWIFISQLIGFILYTLLLAYGLSMFKNKQKKKDIIKLSFLIIIIYYPMVIVFNYFILGKNSLLGLIPTVFAIIFLLFFVFYFSYKK